MQLRPYQSESSAAFIDALRAGVNPVIALPTGSGKSACIADICNRLSSKGGRVVVLAHVQELLAQNAAEYERFTGQTNYGIYSAGLNQYDYEKAITFAGVQSVYKKPQLFQGTDLIIVDEAHTVPPDGEGLMYTSFLSALPEARRGGFTATPWRLDNGVIYGEGRAFDVLAYQKSPIELVDEGYLAPLRGIETADQLNLKGVSKTGGDFSQSAVEKRMGDDNWLETAVAHSITLLKGRKHLVIFTPTIATAKKAAALYASHRVPCEVVSSEDENRSGALIAWKAGEIRAIANVDILTTGFNFPALDAIVCLRPTESSALWVQMLGRGMRRAEGKSDCLVLDYVGNLSRLGGVSTMETWHKQNEKGELRAASKQKASQKAPASAKRIALTNLDPMLEAPGGLMVSVVGVSYACRPGKRPGKSLMLAVYDCVTEDGIGLAVTQFVCVEYDGGARYHAQQWFKRRGSSAPISARVAMVDAYSLKTPKKLKVFKNEGYLNVLKEVF